MEKKQPVPVEVQTAICIRPLLKKERDDAVVLEAQARSGEKGACVALHPLPPKINGEAITPSAALILQTMSPDTIQTGHDEEFRFDHVFTMDPRQTPKPARASPKCLQDQVYTKFGRPTALRAMETIITNNDEVGSRSSHLIVALGNQASGKSHLCWGPGSVSKRKTAEDGIVLRMVDSFFSQFDRLKIKSNQGRKHQYALNLSFAQISQDFHGNSHDNCEVHDILQEKRGFTWGSSGFKRWTNSKSFASSSKASEVTEEPIILEQDPLASDIYARNQSIQTCRSMQEARDAVHNALNNSNKLTRKKRLHSHILVKMQPVLLEKPKPSARVLKMGGTIAVLDMAAVDETERKLNRRHRPGASLMNRSDAHSALIHCLRSILYNESIRKGKTPLTDSLDDAEEDDEATKMSEITCSVMTEPKDALQRQASFKKVPYLRHKLTMLLQPLFSPTFTGEASVTILLAASPGSRDYKEKKGLMQEMESFGNARIGPAKTVVTGLMPVPESETAVETPLGSAPTTNLRDQKKKTVEKFVSNNKKTFTGPPRSNHQKNKISVKRGSEADDEAEPSLSASPRGHHPLSPRKVVIPAAICDRRTGRSKKMPSIQPSASMTYSDTSDEIEEISLPPPVAPKHASKTTLPTRYLQSPNASAPREADVCNYGSDLIHPSLSREDEEAIPPPPAEHFTSTTTTTTTYFQPMRHHLKKAVNLGKKQCGKVWDKVYSTNHGNVDKSNNLAQKDDELEATQILRQKLAARDAECEALRIEKKELQEKCRLVEEDRDQLKNQLLNLPSSEAICKDAPIDHGSEKGYSVPTLHCPALSEIDNKSSASGTGWLTPASRAYADITGPKLPEEDSRVGTMYTERTTTTTTTTTSRPFLGNSLTAHMAKLSSSSPMVATALEKSPWEKWQQSK